LLATATAIACERFRQANGRWPRTLDEIPTSILAAVPLSPFDAKPLTYRVLDDGIVVSCFCRDEKTEYRGPAEYNPLGENGFAEGAWLWNAELRGLPPLPEEMKDKEEGVKER
jgi:hypothetical protein